MSGARSVLVLPDKMPSPYTRVAAVIGDPVSHSLSPSLHNAAFAALGLDWMYVACHVPEGQGAKAVQDMRTLGFKGLSVTMPHKAAVASAVDNLSATAAKLGVVNCVRVEDDRLIGENTDGIGLLNSIRTQMALDVEGLRVVIVGAGGAARSVALTMVENGATVGIYNRTHSSAAQVVEIVGGTSSVVQQNAIRDAELIINATPLGMAPNDPMPFDADLLRDDQSIVDLIYEPAKTTLLKEADSRGLRTLNGLGMLLHQAGEQFRLWTGQQPPIEAMAESVGLTV
ncbi:MAG: shikimate dehydrogenase [Candidatus Poriferisodalaceae bacterium]|nr:MAG: shikimate dehydrogenase [Acidimicrobiales bacterium MED-G01]